MDFNFAKALKLWQSSYKKRCEPQGQVVNERGKDEGNTLETSPLHILRSRGLPSKRGNVATQR